MSKDKLIDSLEEIITDISSNPEKYKHMYQHLNTLRTVFQFFKMLFKEHLDGVSSQSMLNQDGTLPEYLHKFKETEVVFDWAGPLNGKKEKRLSKFETWLEEKSEFSKIEDGVYQLGALFLFRKKFTFHTVFRVVFAGMEIGYVESLEVLNNLSLMTLGEPVCDRPLPRDSKS